MKNFDFKNTIPNSKSKSSYGVIKDILLNSCAFFTVFSMLILATQLFADRDMIDPVRFFMLYPFSLCISLANLIFKTDKIKFLFKIVVHCSITTLSFYILMCLPMKSAKKGVLIILFVILYIIIASIIMIIRKPTKKPKEPQKEYTSMFGNKK